MPQAVFPRALVTANLVVTVLSVQRWIVQTLKTSATPLALRTNLRPFFLRHGAFLAVASAAVTALARKPKPLLMTGDVSA